MSFRQYRRTSSGVDAGIQALLYWLTIVTAPIWIPVVAVLVMYQQCSQKAEAESARLRIAPTKIRIADLKLQSQHNSYKLTGRVYNMSRRFTLTGLDLKLTMRDCVASDQCDTVAEINESPVLDIPPGQARDIDEYVHFSGAASLRGKLNWSYDLIGTRAR